MAGTRGSGKNEMGANRASTMMRTVMAGMGAFMPAAMAAASMPVGGRNQLSMSSMRSEAYGQTPLLRHGEMRRARSAAIAARSGRYLAGGHDPSELGQWESPFDFSARRRPGETANVDRARARAFAREVQRKELHQGSDAQKLGDIAEYTDGINQKMGKLVGE